ncbi:MAG: tRNA pseudouridine(55) synthase TruB, partial [Clostridia bacterium]
MNGFINCNKPSKMTSSDVVCRIKRLCKGNKIGHMGTLDPGAAGVLPIAIGKATRLFDFLTHKKKIYRARFTYGKTTDTLDSYGKLLQTSDIIPNKEQLENILGEFIGNIMQMPPLYSALKVNGAKAYDLARKNIDFELKARNVEVFNFTLNKQIAIDTFEFDIECGGGTYIRSLVRDTAEKLGTVGYMSSL